MNINKYIFILTLSFCALVPSSSWSQTGEISGHVTTVDGSVPATAGLVQLFPIEGDFVAIAQEVVENGAYSLTHIPDGTYALLLSGPYVGKDAYIPQIYDGVPCSFGCAPTREGTPVRIRNGEHKENIDFRLVASGTISGKITGKIQPSELAAIRILTSEGLSAAYFLIATDGTYTSPPLPVGKYYVSAGDNSTGQYEQLFNDVPCPDGQCRHELGSLVSVQKFTNSAGIDFILRVGGVITGRVLDSESGTPVANAAVDIYSDYFDNAQGPLRTTSDEDGSYMFRTSLPPGTYFVSAAARGYVSKLYDELPCEKNCDPVKGTPLVVDSGSVAIANFNLVAVASSPGSPSPGSPSPGSPSPDDSAPQLPDLTGRISTATIKSSKATIHFSLVNAQSSVASAFQVSFFLSNKRTLGAKAKPEKVFNFATLGALERKNLSATIKVRNKRRFVIVKIDTSDSVVETTELNNFLFRALKVRRN